MEAFVSSVWHPIVTGCTFCMVSARRFRPSVNLSACFLVMNRPLSCRQSKCVCVCALFVVMVMSSCDLALLSFCLSASLSLCSSKCTMSAVQAVLLHPSVRPAGLFSSFLRRPPPAPCVHTSLLQANRVRPCVVTKSSFSPRISFCVSEIVETLCGGRAQNVHGFNNIQSSGMINGLFKHLT